MAVRIEVVQGYDAGWSYVVQAREVRIGRGAPAISVCGIRDGRMEISTWSTSRVDGWW